MLRTRQLEVADSPARGRAKFVDERPRLRDRDHEVRTAVNDEKWWRAVCYACDRGSVAVDVFVAVITTLNHDVLQEVDDPVALGSRPVVPVVASVDGDGGVHRRVRVRVQFTLELFVAGGQRRQRCEMATRRAPCDGDEVAVTAELVGVGAGPRDGSLHVHHVAGPAVAGRHPVVDGQAHPTRLDEMRHQRRALIGAAAVPPGPARDEDQDGRGRRREVRAAPDVEQLRFVGAVAHRGRVHMASSLFDHPQHWRGTLGQRPGHAVEIGDDACSAASHTSARTGTGSGASGVEAD